MLGAELYDWLKFGHILMAIIRVGGAIAIQVLAMRIVGQNDPVKLAGLRATSSSSARAPSRRRR